MGRRHSGAVLVALLLAACGGDAGDPIEAGTAATLEPVRGEGTLDRISIGESVEVAELARLRLDSGPTLLLRGANVSLAEDGSVTVASGDVFVDVLAGDALPLKVGETQLSTRDGSFSIEDGVAYVVRGEVAWVQGEQRGVVNAGETLEGTTVAAARLWHDWTGGLARPGPGLQNEVAIGALEGRVPGEVGKARWPLVIRRLDVRVRVVEDLAITEVEQIFFNPASDTVEGLYRIAVPSSAVLQRFSVDRDGQLVDGYVREKAQAQQAYEAQVYRGSTLDPALLEWVAPGRYQARIYPIPAGATRRIVVRYAEWLERPTPMSSRIYRFPMAAGDRAPAIQELSFEADLSGAHAGNVVSGFDAEVDGKTVRMRRSDFRPRSDLYLEILDEEEREEPGPQQAWRAEHSPPPRDPRAGAMPDEQELDYFFVPLVLPTDVFGETPDAMDLVIVADVSAGTDRSHLELGRSTVESITAHLRESDRVAIVASDVGLRALGGDAELGPASAERVERLLDALAREPSGGATDIGGALAEAAALLDPTRHGAVIYVGDGAPTVGELEADALLERVARLPQPLRAYAVGVGDDSQLELLDAITRGGGLALRVETRAAAAEAALQILGHARRPAAHRITVEVEGAQQVFPRTPADVVRGAVLPVVGRIEGDLPSSVTVRGLVGGQELEREIDITSTKLEDEGDLRLRWAAERLRQLLLGGGQREEIADLGVRYGIITPFTSFYVPSAAEMASLGDAADHLRRERAGFAERPRYAFAPTLALLATPACNEAEPMASAESTSTPMDPMEPADEAQESQTAPDWLRNDGNDGNGEDEGGSGRRTRGEEGQMGNRERAAANRYALEAEATEEALPQGQARPSQPSPEPEPAAAAPMVVEVPPSPTTTASAMRASGRRAAPTRIVGGSGGSAGYGDLDLARDQSAADDREASAEDPAPSPDAAELPTEAEAARMGLLGALRRGEGGEGELADLLNGALGSGPTSGLGTTGTGGGGSGPGAELFGNEQRESDEDESGLATRVNVTTRPGRHRIVVDVRTHGHTRHTARRCSDASDLLLDDRRAIWRERIDAAGGVSGWIRVLREARRQCELPAWRDHRALLRLILNRAGNVASMIQVYRQLGGSGSRRYVRRAILRRVRTPADLRLARNAFGSSISRADLVAQVLERAGDGPARIRALRGLVLQFPNDLDLKLQLLEELERQGRIAEARRLAHTLRADPMTDAGIRTAIGEMYLRLEDEDEARRVFSEIVEFAPRDALARRRLGDLYRAHGWFEDAYRQYQTLAAITPDDPSVSLLLAQAAAGTGRVDEALRLEQRLAESTGAEAGLGRIAMLWSSVRFAELRQRARASNDTEQLEALAARMRRSGVLRRATALRATLVWSHPDANLSLWASYPRLSMSRPTDLAPEYGLEAFDVEEQEAGAYQLEVRRLEGRHLTAVTGKLVIVWNEGQEDEKIEVREIRFEGEQNRRAFRVEGRELTEVSQ